MSREEKQAITISPWDVWEDRDPRHRGRQVTIDHVDEGLEGFVYYSSDHQFKLRSRTARFLKAYPLISREDG